MDQQFGVGRLFSTRTDVANSTPQSFGVLQDVTFDLGFTTKPLIGTSQFAIFTARGMAKWTFKAKTATFSGNMMNSLFLGQSLVSGQVATAVDEAGTVPGVSTYLVTVANSATFVLDQGVKYAAGASAGLPLAKVASAPTIGQYTVAAGVYTFAAADANAVVAICYTYSIAAIGTKIVISQQQLGTTPVFSSVFRNRDAKTGLYSTFVLNRATCNKLVIDPKQEDFQMHSFDCEIMADDTGQIGTLSTGDAS